MLKEDESHKLVHLVIELLTKSIENKDLDLEKITSNIEKLKDLHDPDMLQTFIEEMFKKHDEDANKRLNNAELYQFLKDFFGHFSITV